MTSSTVSIKAYKKKDLVKILNARFPGVKKWYVHFPSEASGLVDASQRGIVGHKGLPGEPMCCITSLTDANECGREADLMMIDAIFDGPEDEPVLKAARVRYYCAPCMYVTATKALTNLSGPDQLKDVVENGIEDVMADILDQKTALVQDAVAVAVDKIEEVHGEEGDKIIAECSEKLFGITAKTEENS